MSAPRGRTRPGLVLVVLCVSLLIVSLDNTILNVALPAITRALNATSAQLQWIVDSYAIVFAGLLLVLGSLGDRLGRKRVFMAGLVTFALGSAASAFSGSPDRLMAARAFMGLGSAAIMPSTLSLLTNVFSDDTRRARAIGIWSGTTGLGVAIGPVVGGWLLSQFWWGSVFLVNVPIALVGLVATGFLVPDSRDSRAKRPDPAGALLSVGGMGLLLWGIIDAPTRTWSSPVVLGALGASVVLLGCFFAWERRSAHAMLEVDFFRHRRFSVAIGSMALVIFALMGSLFLLTQYLQFSLGYTPLQTGLRVGPVAAVLLVFAPLSNLIVRWIGTKAVAVAGMSSISAGLLLLSHTSVHGTYLDSLPALMSLGVGTGLAFAPCTDSVMGSVPIARAGIGAATNGAGLQLGGALGVGLLGSLLNGRYGAHMSILLSHYPVPPAVASVVRGSLGGALAVAHGVGGPAGAALAQAGRVAFVNGMDLATVVGAAAVAVSALLALVFLPARPEAGRPARGSTGRPQAAVPAAA